MANCHENKLLNTNTDNKLTDIHHLPNLGKDSKETVRDKHVF